MLRPRSPAMPPALPDPASLPSGPSRNVPPEIGDRRSPPCFVLGVRQCHQHCRTLRPCLAAPAAGLSGGTLREDPLVLELGVPDVEPGQLARRCSTSGRPTPP